MNETQQVTNTAFFSAVVFMMQHNILRAETPVCNPLSGAESQLGAALLGALIPLLSRSRDAGRVTWTQLLLDGACFPGGPWPDPAWHS